MRCLTDEESTPNLDKSIENALKLINNGFYTENYNASTFKIFCSDRKSVYVASNYHEIIKDITGL